MYAKLRFNLVKKFEPQRTVAASDKTSVGPQWTVSQSEGVEWNLRSFSKKKTYYCAYYTVIILFLEVWNIWKNSILARGMEEYSIYC